MPRFVKVFCILACLLGQAAAEALSIIGGIFVVLMFGTDIKVVLVTSCRCISHCISKDSVEYSNSIEYSNSVEYSDSVEYSNSVEYSDSAEFSDYKSCISEEHDE